jgi:hypothetical protein
MMFIVSLVEFSIPKTRMWKRRNVQLANFDVTSLRVIWVSLGLAFGFPAHRNEQSGERLKLTGQKIAN